MILLKLKLKMNNRKEKMNEFLNYMPSIAYYNPSLEINEDLVNHYKKINNPEYKKYEKQHIEGLKELTYEQKKQILYSVVVETIKKYGVNQINYAIQMYLMEGKTNLITRENNLRKNFSMLSKDDIKNIISEKLGRNFNSNKDIESFVESFYKKMTLVKIKQLH